MQSIRRHLTYRLAAGTVLLAVAGVLGAYGFLRLELIEMADRSLLSRASTLGSLVHIDDDTGRVEFDVNIRAASEFNRKRRPDYFQIWHDKGDVLVRSPSLGDLDPDRAPSPMGDGLAPHAFYDIKFPDGRRGRAVEYRFEAGHEDERVVTAEPRPPSGHAITLVLATDLQELWETLGEILIGYGVLLVITATATVLLVTGTTRRGLRPLEDIGEAVSKVDPATLDSRVQIASLPEELKPIAEKLNDLLARLDEGFRRERRFTSNVAHELRTPIAELRALAEVAARWPGDAEATSRTLGDVVSISRQMESITSALLALARSRSGQQVVTLKPLDLRETMREAWRPHAAVASARGLQVDVDALSPGTAVWSDAALLTAMLGNLFANAVAYTPAGGKLTCRGRSAGGVVTLELSNTNDTLTPADLPLLSEPFWRKHSSWTETPHSGLGMTLVTGYATLLGIRIETSLPTPDVFWVALEIPAAEVGSGKLGV